MKTAERIESLKLILHKEWLADVQAVANKYQVEIATGHMSDMWQVSEDGGNTWLHEIYDSHPALKELEDIDAQYASHGIGPSNLERFTPTKTEYETQAETFLAENGLKLRITLSDSKPAPWSPAGHHYRVTLSAPGRKRVTFDFWDSIANAKILERSAKAVESLKNHEWKASINRHAWLTNPSPSTIDPYMYEVMMATEVTQWRKEAAESGRPTAYDILACISGDAYCPETFADFCAEYGYDEDSLKAMQQWKRAASFARRLHAFFTSAELAQLSEIR